MKEINVFGVNDGKTVPVVYNNDTTFEIPCNMIKWLSKNNYYDKFLEALYAYVNDADITKFANYKNIPFIFTNPYGIDFVNITDDEKVKSVLQMTKSGEAILGILGEVLAIIYAERNNIPLNYITPENSVENQIVVVDATESTSSTESRAERIARKMAQIEQYNREHVVVDISPAARKSAQQNNTNPVIVPINTQHNAGCTCGNCSTVPGGIDSRTIRYNYYNYAGLVRDGQVIARNLTGPDMNRHSIEEIMSVVSQYQSLFQVPGTLMKVRSCPRSFLEDNDISVAETAAARNAMQQKQVNAFDVCTMDKIYPESVLDIALFTKADTIDPSLSGVCHVPAFSICVDYKACIAKYTIDANGNKVLNPMAEPTIYVGCNLTYNGKDLTRWFRNEPTEDPVIIARIPFSMQNLNECLKAIAGIFGIIV